MSRSIPAGSLPDHRSVSTVRDILQEARAGVVIDYRKAGAFHSRITDPTLPTSRVVLIGSLECKAVGAFEDVLDLTSGRIVEVLDRTISICRRAWNVAGNTQLRVGCAHSGREPAFGGADGRGVVDPSCGAAIRIRLTPHPTELVVGHGRRLQARIRLLDQVPETVVFILPRSEIRISRLILSAAKIIVNLDQVAGKVVSLDQVAFCVV